VSGDEPLLPLLFIAAQGLTEKGRKLLTVHLTCSRSSSSSYTTHISSRENLADTLFHYGTCFYKPPPPPPPLLLLFLLLLLLLRHSHFVKTKLPESLLFSNRPLTFRSRSERFFQVTKCFFKTPNVSSRIQIFLQIQIRIFPSGTQLADQR
jgi:hypothetical protein